MAGARGPRHSPEVDVEEAERVDSTIGWLLVRVQTQQECRRGKRIAGSWVAQVETLNLRIKTPSLAGSQRFSCLFK